MSAGHSHGTASGANEKKLWIVLLLTGSFLVVEVIGGLLTNSLTLLSDAAHMFTDVVALVIAIVAIRLGRTARRSKTHFRLLPVRDSGRRVQRSGSIPGRFLHMYEAYQRFISPPEVQALGMLGIGVTGAACEALGPQFVDAIRRFV